MFGIWYYDLPPYFLCAKVDETRKWNSTNATPRVAQKGTLRYIPSMQGWFRCFATVSNTVGKRLVRERERLAQQHYQWERAIRDEVVTRARGLCPELDSALAPMMEADDGC